MKPIYAVLLGFSLTACDGGEVTSENDLNLALQQRIAQQCSVVAPNLNLARAQFSVDCGGVPRDCDPAGDQWQCANIVIGNSAPPAVVLPVVGHSAEECTVKSEALVTAQQIFAEQCQLPRRDCDLIDGYWYCSSIVLGQSAPPIAQSYQPNTASFEQSVSTSEELAQQAKVLIQAASLGEGLKSYMLPDSDQLDSIPQDPKNLLTPAKVALGKLLFHDTAFAINGRLEESMSWSCATCHHAAAGFKAGARQGIGNGGTGFGVNGSERRIADGFNDRVSPDDQRLPDFQPVASPTVLHVAWQDVMLWNGQFGNSENGIVNVGVPSSRLGTAGTPKQMNNLGLSGVETQAIAGTGVHRLKFANDTPLKTNATYSRLWQEAYGNSSIDPLEGAGKAIAAFERTVIANKAPFQQWLRGDSQAMTEDQTKGAVLFFGAAGCSGCHQGPALSSRAGASASEMFMAVGFADMDHENPNLLGEVDNNTRLGRGGFTGEASENYQFKIPQLYNLKDAAVLGHGGSFSSVKEVIEYKNQAIAQNKDALPYLDHRFQPLTLSQAEMNQLETFIVDALYDPDLQRYQPRTVPSGQCVVVDAGSLLATDLCPE